MSKKAKQPLDLIFQTYTALDAFKRYGTGAFPTQQERDALLLDARDSIEILMEFRNIVSAMALMKERPAHAAAPYVEAAE